MRNWTVLIAALFWTAGATVVAAQNVRVESMEGNAEAIARGSPLFRARCAGCHGPDAKGVSGPDLRAALGGMSDERFFRIVRGGQGTEMPRFGSDTASGLVFAGDSEGNFIAFDGRSGKDSWHDQTGAPIFGSANTFMLDGRQYVLNDVPFVTFELNVIFPMPLDVTPAGRQAGRTRHADVLDGGFDDSPPHQAALSPLCR